MLASSRNKMADECISAYVLLKVFDEEVIKWMQKYSIIIEL